MARENKPIDSILKYFFLWASNESIFSRYLSAIKMIKEKIATTHKTARYSLI